MEEELTFTGTKEQVLISLQRYMSAEDAILFFETYFDAEELTLYTIAEELSDKHRASALKSTSSRRTQTIRTSGAPAAKFAVCYQSPRHTMSALGGAQSYIRCSHYNISKRNNMRTSYSAKPKRTLTIQEINSSQITIKRKSIPYFFKVLSKAAFIFMLTAISKSVELILVSATIEAVSFLIKTLFADSPRDKEVASCIISVVEANGYLPKFQSFKKSNCRNLKIKCPYVNYLKCGITKDKFAEVVTKLISKKILMADDKRLQD